ncbi:MAG: O-antigen ligase family protein [Desulfobacterium sp.]|nr:O-antigen ligase family protein [Desulfobacterium sp.]
MKTPYSDTAFYIICSLIVLAPLARGSVHPWATTIIQACVLIALILVVIESLVSKRAVFPPSPMAKPIIAIIALSGVSALYSDHKPLAFEGFCMLLTYVVIYFITLFSTRTRQQQRTLVYIIVSTALLLAIIGILKRFGLTPSPWWIYPDVGLDHASTSVSGAYVNRNHLAGFLEMAIPLLMALFLTRQRSLEAKSGMIVLLLFLVITQAFTLSRGGWISAVAAILFMAAVLLAQKNFVHKKLVLTIGTGVIIISVFILASTPVVQRITTLTQEDPTDNISGRIRCWKGVVGLIKDNPMTGTGPNTFTAAYPAYQIPGDAILRRFAHNDYLHFISATGIMFVPVMLYSLFCFFRAGFDSLKSRSRQTRGFTLGAMAAVFAILVHSFSDFNLNIPANALLFTVILTLVPIPSVVEVRP